MRRVHGATVEQVGVPADTPFCAGDEAFVAVCLVTGAVCDAWGFVEPEGPRGILEPGEGAAIERALAYLGDRSLHEAMGYRGPGGTTPTSCNADHVMAHDLSSSTGGAR